MDNDEMMQVVRALRKQGWSPKEIARKLGVRPAAIAPLVRLLATEQAATADQTLPAECWVTPGWSAGLGVNGHPEWPRGNAAHGESSGLVGVVVARELRNRQVSACGYLVDVWCMGVKNALGPKAGDRLALRRILDMFRSSFGSSPIEAPPALAPQIVLGAVDYARGLGIEPHPDFAPARGHLGPWDAKGAITFGRQGKPYFVQGPTDDPELVLNALGASVGDGNYHYVIPINPPFAA